MKKQISTMQLTNNLAYLLGALRDGSVCRFKNNQGKICSSVTFYSKSIKWLNVLQKKIFEVFKINTKIVQYGNKTPYIRIYSKELVDELNKKFQCPLKTQIGWITPLFIKNSDDIEIIKNYIAGFWDAEGGVNLQSKQVAFYLSWNGKRCPPLEDLKKMLEKLKIKCGNVCRYKNERGVYPRFVLRISMKDNERFFRSIPTQNPEKRRSLLKLISHTSPQNSLPAEGLGPENGRD
jgi:hypothetical protein